VIVDLNAASGGNCELTRPGEVFTTEGGVTIVGHECLPGTLPHTASMLLSNNLTSFLTSIAGEEDWVLSEDDEVLFGPAEGEPFHVSGMGGVLLCRGGVLDPHHTRLQEVMG
jgi:NAD(P) transhydrogenase subunit alpha